MTSAMYLRGRAEIGNGGIDYLTDTIKIALLDNTYIPDMTGDEYFDDVSGDEIVGTGYTAGGETLAGKAVNLDVANNRVEFDANNVTGWATAAFTDARYAVVYKDTGTESTSALICLLDLGSEIDAPFNLLFDANGLFTWGAC